MLVLKVPDMSCGGCAATITKAVKDVDPAATVEADLATKRVAIETGAAPDAILKAIRAVDYAPVLA